MLSVSFFYATIIYEGKTRENVISVLAAGPELVGYSRYLLFIY